MAQTSNSQMDSSTESRRTTTNAGEQLREHVKESVDTIKHDVVEMTNAAREATEEKVQELREVARQQSKIAESRIASEPMKSVMVAGGIGFVLGLLFSRR